MGILSRVYIGLSKLYQLSGNRELKFLRKLSY